MTEESLRQANLIKQELDRITEAKHSIMAYRNERIELDVTVKKGLMHYAAEDSTRHYTLYSDSPLFIAIASALEGMREELQDQLDNLDVNMKSKGGHSYEDSHPIAKTSWWKKAFRWKKDPADKANNINKLPRWKKCEVSPHDPGVFRVNVGWIEYMGYQIDLKELFKKLDKEETV